MPHTSLLSNIAGLFQERATEFRPSRRALLRGAALAASKPLAAFAGPKVAIVGAGLAGLTCAYRLQQRGIAARVFEASERLGGRCWTLRGAFSQGQFVERGGELIDQGHKAVRQLAQELRLPLDNLLAAEPNGAEPMYFFQGKPYTVNEARADIKKIWQKLHRDLSEASYPTTYYQSTARGRELDSMSIRDWILETVPGGYTSRLAQLLDVAYNIEYGAETEQQSALNLIYLLGYRGQGQIRLFGPSNEKYRVRGGNDRIVAELASRLSGQVECSHRLTGVNLDLNGSYTLSFAGKPSVTVDRVVLALPFSVLRSSVNLANAGLSPRKLKAINELGMGQNAKQHLQFRSRVWNALGGNGESYSDTGYQITWEVTRGQQGTAGILVNYTGGNRAVAANGLAPAQVLAQIEPVMPGLTAHFNGQSQLEHWPSSPFTLGSYSFWKPGQYQQFAGVEGEAEGGVHFCGEHTSLDFQGYLNGAVDSGERAAKEIASLG
jgi:monoamine oxidase